MVSVQRRLNSTGRKRITRDKVIVELQPALDAFSFPMAQAQIRLDGLALDPNAAVVLEAYYRSSSMRFRCGTVKDLKVPPLMILTEIDRGGAVQFRLLVISADGRGKILASAEGLKPLEHDSDLDRQPLLPLRETDLAEELWRVDIHERNGPTLLVNSRVPGLAAQLRNSPMVQGMILPQALRETLRMLPAEGEDESDDDDWGLGWRKFLEQLGLPGEPDDPGDDESVHEWIEAAVAEFARVQRFAYQTRTGGKSEADHA